MDRYRNLSSHMLSIAHKSEPNADSSKTDGGTIRQDVNEDEPPSEDNKNDEAFSRILNKSSDRHKSDISDGIPPLFSDQKVPWKRTRYLMIALITAGITLAMAARITMSIGIVAMTDRSANADFKTFNWNLSTQSTLLSSFFWGYVVTNIPAGLLLRKFGVRWFFLGTLFINGLATLVVPVVAEAWDWQGVCVFRVLLGASQGFVFPAFSALLSKWATPSERGRLASICFSGMQIGNIMALSIGGVLASSSGGWPSIFYLFGGLSLGWCVFWFFLGFDSPNVHPYISEKEKEYIISYYGETGKQSFKIPWKSIAFSIPLWSTLICHCIQNWGYYMILNESPTYMKNVLQFNIQENGTLTAMPYVVMLLLIFFFGWFSDFLIDRKILSLMWTRKLFNTIGLIGPMATMIGLGYVGKEEKVAAVALLIISCGLNAGVYVGFFVNHVELSPNFASVLMGITNSAGNCISLIVPLVVAAVVKEEESEQEWQTLFWITGGLYLVGSLVYIFLSSNEVQPWDKQNSSHKS